MGRNLGDMMAGMLGKVEAEKATAVTPPPSQAERLGEQLKAARESGDTEAASSVLFNIARRRKALSETGIIKEDKPKRRATASGNVSVVPNLSVDEIRRLLTPKTGASASSSIPTINASKEQMRDIANEVTGWGSEPSSPGQWTPKTLENTDEVKEMAASPEGPKTPPSQLASVLMDKLEAHHAHLTQLLKTLPENLRSHAQHSPYFGPAHDHFANQLESRGAVSSFDKSDRDALREKRELIERSPLGGSKFEIRRRNAMIDQNFAATTYGEAGRSYIQDVPAGPTTLDSIARRKEALSNINEQIKQADAAGRNAPAHIQSLTVDLPSRLAALKNEMNEIRENGVFQTDDPGINHKAILDIADKLSTINNSINSSIMAGTKSAINDTFSGTGLSLQNKFKNFFGSSIHKKTFDHIKWMAKGLSQAQPGQTWRDHSEPHPDYTAGVQPNNLTRVLKGLSTTKGLTMDEVMSKRGHIWGLQGKDEFGYRRKGNPREQLQINEENARTLLNSNDADESGLTAKDLGRKMLNIIKDYNAGNTAKYQMYKLPAEWQPTSGKYGSGTSRIRGSGDTRAQRTKQDLFSYTTEAVEKQEKRAKPIETVDAEGNVVRAPVGTGGVFVKGTKNKAPRSQAAMSREVNLGKVSREAAIGKVKEMSTIAGAVERAKAAGTTYDKEGNTKPISEEDSKLLAASPESMVEVYNHVRAHQQLIEKHVDTVKNQGRNAIPKEDRKILGPSGMAEVNRRAKL